MIMALPLLLGAAKGLIGSGKKKPKSGKEVAEKVVQRKEQKDTKKPSTQKKLAPAQVSGKKFFGGKSSTPKIKKLKPNTGNSQLDNVLESIQSSIAKLGSTIKNFVKFKRKDNQDKTKRKNKMLAKLREVGFGMVGGVLSLGKKLLSKIPFFDRIKNFFVNILLGGLVLMILDNIKPIIEVIKGVVEKIKEVFGLIKKYLFDPMIEAGKFIINTVLPIINDIINSAPAQFIKTQIESLIKTIGDQFPQLEKVLEDLKNIQIPGMGLLKDLIGTDNSSDSSQYDTSSGGLLASGGVEQGEKAKSQVSQAGFGESEFTLYRDTVAQIESGGKYDIQGGSKDEFGVGMYAGRYQMDATAREDAARLLGETYQGDSEAARKTFREDKQMQERYFAAYTRANHQYLMNRSPEYKELPKEEKLQVLGYAHNLGWRSAAEWLSRGRTNSGADGAGTKSDTFAKNIKKAQEQRRLRSQRTSSGGAYDTGLKTGPSARIGGSSEYHIDAQFMNTMSMEEKVALADQMAQGYAARGRKMEFSNSAVSGEVYNPSADYAEKAELLRRAFDAHGHSRYSDRASIDFYVPTTNQNRYQSSVEGAPLLAPTVEGGSLTHSSGGNYGNFVEIRDKSGNVIFRMGHGDTRYGRKSGTVQFDSLNVTPPALRSTAEEISKQTDYEKMRTIFMPIAVPTGGGGDSGSGGGGPTVIGSGSAKDTYLQIMMENKLFKQ